MFTWKAGTFWLAMIGNSTDVYEQNGMKMAATFCETRFCMTVFITSGDWSLVSSLTSSILLPPMPPASLISDTAIS